eukprot:5635584-Ditylum_brightwellii.AAC.1
MLETAKAARKTANLHISPRTKTWIEVVEEETKKINITFPLEQSDFAGFVSLMMEDSNFRILYGGDIGTTGPGVGGDFVFTSLTFLQEVGGGDSREDLLERWKTFANDLNSNALVKAGQAVVYSNAFNEAYRKNAILSTTLSSWALAN